MNTSLGNLAALPSEVLLPILMQLSPTDLSRVSKIDRRLNVLARDKSLWRSQMEKYFPNEYAMLTLIKPEVDWYNSFIIVLKEMTKMWSSDEVKLFICIKEDDLAGVAKLIQEDQKNPLESRTLKILRDSLDFKNKLLPHIKSQEMRNYFHTIFLKLESELQAALPQKERDKKAAHYQKRFLALAIIFNQLEEVQKHAEIINSDNYEAALDFEHIQEMQLDPETNEPIAVAIHPEIINSADRLLLSLVASSEHVEMIRLLLSENPSPKILLDLATGAAKEGHIAVIQVLIDKQLLNIDHIKETLLALAAENGQFHMVAFLIGLGASVHPEPAAGDLGTFPLHKAALGGQLHILKCLYDHNADFNAQDEYGLTPLMHVCSFPSHNATVNALIAAQILPDIVTQLIRWGANVDIVDIDGRTALHHAINYNIQYLEVLLKHGANISAQDNNGESAIVYAFRSLEALKSLLAKIPDLSNVKNNNGLTALQIAENSNNVPVITLLSWYPLILDLHKNNDIKQLTVHQLEKINSETIEQFDYLKRDNPLLNTTIEIFKWFVTIVKDDSNFHLLKLDQPIPPEKYQDIINILNNLYQAFKNDPNCDRNLKLLESEAQFYRDSAIKELPNEEQIKLIKKTHEMPIFQNKKELSSTITPAHHKSQKLDSQ